MKALTVGELRVLLAQYPDDMPVVATWEGIVVNISRDRFSVGPAKRKDTTDSLVIDVDTD